MRRFPAMVKLVKDADSSGKVVVAVCLAFIERTIRVQEELKNQARLR